MQSEEQQLELSPKGSIRFSSRKRKIKEIFDPSEVKITKFNSSNFTEDEISFEDFDESVNKKDVYKKRRRCVSLDQVKKVCKICRDTSGKLMTCKLCKLCYHEACHPLKPGYRYHYKSFVCNCCELEKNGGKKSDVPAKKTIVKKQDSPAVEISEPIAPPDNESGVFECEIMDDSVRENDTEYIRKIIGTDRPDSIPNKESVAVVEEIKRKEEDCEEKKQDAKSKMERKKKRKTKEPKSAEKSLEILGDQKKNQTTPIEEKSQKLIEDDEEIIILIEDADETEEVTIEVQRDSAKSPKKAADKTEEVEIEVKRDSGKAPRKAVCNVSDDDVEFRGFPGKEVKLLNHSDPVITVKVEADDFIEESQSKRVKLKEFEPPRFHSNQLYTSIETLLAEIPPRFRENFAYKDMPNVYDYTDQQIYDYFTGKFPDSPSIPSALMKNKINGKKLLMIEKNACIKQLCSNNLCDGLQLYLEILKLKLKFSTLTKHLFVQPDPFIRNTIRFFEMY